MNSREIRNKVIYMSYIMTIIALQIVEIAGCIYSKILIIFLKLLYMD